MVPRIGCYLCAQIQDRPTRLCSYKRVKVPAYILKLFLCKSGPREGCRARFQDVHRQQRGVFDHLENFSLHFSRLSFVIRRNILVP